MEVNLRWNRRYLNLRTAFDNMSDEDKLVRSECRTLSESAQKIDFNRMSVDAR